VADARTVDIQTHTGELGGEPVYWREGPTPGDRSPVLYVHGVPTSSDDWVPFLERTGGVAPDLPGFGRTSKRGDLDYSIAGIDRFVERFLAEREIDRVRLVVHDWGSAALAFAQRLPERIDRLVIINAVPLLPGYRWHRTARVWRTRGLGELAMGMSSRWVLKQALREANATAGTMPDAFVRSVHAHFDQGTQRAILRLYRSADPEVLAAAGARLGDIAAPALVVWGKEDPYLPPAFADDFAAALPDARAHVVAGAGHWPWYDVPDLIEEIVAFLDGPGPTTAGP
jgi:pimeloyl-ACP methyl ester carboxylesterase